VLLSLLALFAASQASNLQLTGPKAGGACALCEFVVSKLDNWLGENSTETAIVNAVESVCSVLPSTLTADCDAMISAYGPELIQMFINKEQPDVMCKQLALCASEKPRFIVKKHAPIPVRKSEADSGCALCEFIMSEVEDVLAANATQAEIEAALDNACNILPKTLTAMCVAFVNQYADAIIQLLLNKEPPSTICTQLGLCSSTRISAGDSAPVIDDAIIAAVNKQAKWKAGRSPRFQGVSIAQAKRLLGTRLGHPVGTKFYKAPPQAYPVSFDSRTKWPGCVHPVRNQAQCGSCWAFGATESLSDRFCIANKTQVILAPQWLVSCDTTDFGCEGGYLQNAWEFMAGTGVVTNNCDPYTSQEGDVAPCPSSCSDGSNFNTHYFARPSTINTLTDAKSMQAAIMTNGPVEAGFSVYQDFFSYTSGVYVYTSGQLMGGHAIKIVGWGVDTATQQDYWIVYNSWGTSWGMNGLFWILRGVNECGIESNVVVGLPKI